MRPPDIARVLPIWLAVAASLAAQTDRAQQIDAIFQTWNKPDSPGAAVAVIEHGKIAYEKGYGSANLEYSIPIRPETIFHVASVSKQFTAMAIVLLERDGKLSIEDDVHKYLPELPQYGSPIKLRNLLQHTSGIRDQWQTLATAGWSLEDVITQEQILRMLFRQKELNFTPGSRHLYSNSGFHAPGGNREARVREAAPRFLRGAHFPPSADDSHALSSGSAPDRTRPRLLV